MREVLDAITLSDCCKERNGARQSPSIRPSDRDVTLPDLIYVYRYSEYRDIWWRIRPTQRGFGIQASNEDKIFSGEK